MPTYNADAVQRTIDRDPTIGPAEGKTIHALLRGRARSRSPGCTCYVASLDAESRFGLRWGAHGLACPRYRRSLDPVDDALDQAYREVKQIEIMLSTDPATHSTGHKAEE